MSEFRIVRVDANAAGYVFCEEREALEGISCELTGADASSEEELIAALKDADIAITAAASFTRRVFEALPRLRGVIRTGVGYDTIDVEAATDNGVLLINNPAPAWCVEEVSNQAILLMLSSARKLVKLHNLCAAGEWRMAQRAALPQECIHGQTMGIIGCGAIGRCVAKKGAAFRMHILGYDPYLSPALAEEAGIRLVSLDTLCREADYIMMQAALTEETFHMLSAHEFSLMKSNAFVVNTSRGACIDEAALVAALRKGQIAGAGLDVLEEEPPKEDNPLLSMDNVTILPHCASWSTMAFKTMNRTIGEEAAQLLKGERPAYVVNRDCISKFGL